MSLECSDDSLKNIPSEILLFSIKINGKCWIPIKLGIRIVRGINQKIRGRGNDFYVLGDLVFIIEIWIGGWMDGRTNE